MLFSITKTAENYLGKYCLLGFTMKMTLGNTQTLQKKSIANASNPNPNPNNATCMLTCKQF